jgi:hypothetical protein
MNPLNLPATYTPYAAMRIGDNVIKNAQVLFIIGGHAPLLVGKGAVPRIWLSIPGTQVGAPCRELNVDNVPSQHGLTVEAFPRLVKVQLAQTAIFTATRVDNDTVVMLLFDLRPLGLEIFADALGLHVMGSTLTKTQFHGLPVVLAFEAPQ